MSSIDICGLRQLGGGAIYAIGDIHGRLDLTIEIERLILEDIAKTKPLSPILLYLGDYIDRGPNSAQVIDHLLVPNGVERVFLKGNHEDRMLHFLDQPDKEGAAWLKFGGREALESYGVSVGPFDDRQDWAALRTNLKERLPVQHLDFLRDLLVGARWKDYLFVHAGINPSHPLTAQPERDLMWIREPFLSATDDWGLRVVHGHVIVAEPVFRPNRIGIDTGAQKTGILTCLVIAEDGLRLLQTAMHGWA